MAHRVSYEWTYQSSRLGGWSENFWNVTNDVVEVEKRANKLLSVLRPLHNPGAYPAEYRLQQVSDTGSPTQGGLTRIVDTGIKPDPQGGDFDGDYITTSLLLFLADTNGRNSRQWISGIFDNIIKNDGTFVTNADFNIRFNNFYNTITDGGQGWNVRRADLTNWPRKPITDFAPTTGVFTSKNHGIPQGALVKLGRTAPYRYLSRKLWNIDVLDVDTFKLVGNAPVTSAGPFTSRPFVRNNVSSLTQITKALFLRATSHKRGRPFGQYSGRRRTLK